MTGKTKLKRGRPALENMISISIRMPLDTWEKLSWLAAEQSTTRADTVRLILGHSVRHAKPPEDRKVQDIGASETDWQSWHDLAQHLDMPLEQLIKKTMNGLHKRVFT